MPTMPPMPTLPPTLELPTIPPLPTPDLSGLTSIAPIDIAGAQDAVSAATDSMSDAASSAAASVSDAASSAIDTLKDSTPTLAPGTLPGLPAPADVAQEVTSSTGGGSSTDKYNRAENDHPFFIPVLGHILESAAGAKPFCIPMVGLIFGASMMQVPSIATWGKLVLYFGAQSFMNIFMSWVLGTHITIEKGTTLRNGEIQNTDLKGCPAAFALTALQQVVSFVMFMTFFVAVYNTKYRYMPKHLTTTFEYISVFVFGCVFAANIALNNFSLCYISIAVNLIIRSCLPLTTYLSQQGLSTFGLYQRKPFRLLEIILMVLGVFCATFYIYADFEGKMKFDSRLIGVLACLASLLCGSLNLALAGVLGDTKLNTLDTVAYMAIPATIFLAPLIFLYSKPVPDSWVQISQGQPMTDWQIIQEMWYYNKTMVGWLFISGIFSFMYNICQFNIVHTLSPSATAFGGNFNKAALTFMTLLLPFLQTKPNPPAPYIEFQWIALLLNIYAFSHYSYLQIKAKMDAAKAHVEMEEDSESSDEEEGGSGSDE